jgi:hypothetical protein
MVDETSPHIQKMIQKIFLFLQQKMEKLQKLDGKMTVIIRKVGVIEYGLKIMMAKQILLICT